MRTALIISVALLPGAFRARADDLPTMPDDVKKVLERWVGTWSGESTVAPGPWFPQGAKEKGVGTAEWALNGKFIRHVGKSEQAAGDKKLNIESVYLLTWDPHRKAYLAWHFASGMQTGGPGGHWYGPAVHSVGKWDEVTRTLTWEDKDTETGLTSTGHAKFLDDDNQEWAVTVKDRSGKVMFDVKGRNIRQKAGAK